MYFTTFNHYDDDDDDNDTINNDQLCLICWDATNKISKMKLILDSSIYYSDCSCNGYFHHHCLMKWIYKTNSCPICRTKLEINVDDNLILNLNLNWNIFKIFKLFFTFILIRILYDIMFNIQYEVEKNIQSQEDIHYNLSHCPL